MFVQAGADFAIWKSLIKLRVAKRKVDARNRHFFIGAFEFAISAVVKNANIFVSQYTANRMREPAEAEDRIDVDLTDGRGWFDDVLFKHAKEIQLRIAQCRKL